METDKLTSHGAHQVARRSLGTHSISVSPQAAGIGDKGKFRFLKPERDNGLVCLNTGVRDKALSLTYSSLEQVAESFAVFLCAM